MRIGCEVTRSCKVDYRKKVRSRRRPRAPRVLTLRTFGFHRVKCTSTRILILEDDRPPASTVQLTNFKIIIQCGYFKDHVRVFVSLMPPTRHRCDYRHINISFTASLTTQTGCIAQKSKLFMPSQWTASFS